MNRDYTGIIYAASEDATALGEIQKVFADVTKERREQMQATLRKNLPSLEDSLEAIAEKEVPSQNPQPSPPSV